MMIDIYSHILLWDSSGAKHMPESLSIVRKANEQGIKKIIATPIMDVGNHKKDITEKVQELNKLIRKEGIPVTIFPGQKVNLVDDVLTGFTQDHILPLNNFIFIELPTDHIPLNVRELFFDIQVRDYQIIISHPETNKLFIENSDLLYEFVKNGAFIQLSASSVVGKNGRKAQKFAREMIEANLAHFVASNAKVNAGIYLEKAYEKIEKKFGIEKVYFFKENTQAIIDNSSIMVEQPIRLRGKMKV
ncbi:tyrosine-protein phosphatase [Gracilibacillus massiliensis]|uniref:tyrosine-protein phosphatase n=1 Tax=Gracilibacillus massiliensis TaxID=1564956 RepID=UPI0011DE4139|nr:CpsB/CapC family capsule biosynthesis tyrosine phosphatase [Gracilibacillus massiliensis]